MKAHNAPGPLDIRLVSRLRSPSRRDGLSREKFQALILLGKSRMCYLHPTRMLYEISRFFMASSMEAWNTPISCFSWMFNELPRDFSSLPSILFCNAVPGVGGTVQGVLSDRDSKCNGWGRGGEENKFSAAPSRSA